MNNITNQQLKLFLNTCTICYDEYDMYNNNAILQTPNGEQFASVDYDTNKIHCENYIYINDDTKVKVSEIQIETIINFINSETTTQRFSKAQAKNDDYDVASEQALNPF